MAKLDKARVGFEKIEREAELALQVWHQQTSPC